MPRPPASVIRKHWPETAGVVLLVALVAVQANRIIAANGGTFTYCLDDAYIHLAIAKNLTLHHVWGVTQYQFSSASSSPMWDLLLSADFLLQGVHTSAPLVLNLVCAILALVAAATLARRHAVPQPFVFALVAALVLLIPLSTVILDGMEHSFHVLLVLLWILAVDDALEVDQPPTPRQYWVLGVLAFVLTLTRFESLALILVTSVVFLLRARWHQAVFILLSASVAFSAFAVFSLAHGWHAFPNSVLMKVPRRDWHTPVGIWHALGGRSLILMRLAPHMGALFAGAVLLLVWLARPPVRQALTGSAALLAIFAVTTVIHLQFGQLGWFYRYEAYLVAFGIVALTVAIFDGIRNRKGRWSWAVVTLAACLPAATLGSRAVTAWERTPLAAKNIYDQQWQMASFLKSSLDRGSVAVNDIGVVAFETDAHILDFIGLASLDVADAKLEGLRQNPRGTAQLARRHSVDLAVIYDDDVPGGVPLQWKLIGRWRAPPPLVMLPHAQVSFYAVNATLADELRAKLATFSASKLPPDVSFWIAHPGEGSLIRRRRPGAKFRLGSGSGGALVRHS